MEHFNWIIDNVHKEVWAQPIKSGKETHHIIDNNYLFSEINNKLVVVAKKKDEKLKFPLFQQIVKVNNDSFTNDNVCYYVKYLNNPENLRTSKLVFKE